MQLIRNFGKIAKNMAHQLFHVSENPHEVGRDHRHLDDQYRRKILAPDAAHKHLLQLLTKDEHFLSLVDDADRRFLVRACLIGEELRANVYEMARFPWGLMAPTYNPTWRKDDVLHYAFSDVDGERQCMLISHESCVDPTFTYDPYEPIHSYQRTLTSDEVKQVNCYSRPHQS